MYKARVDKNIPVGKVRTRFKVYSKEAARAGSVEAAAFFNAHADYARENAVATYSIEYIDRCDRYPIGKFQTPAKGRYFPIEICYGARWSYHFTSKARRVGGGLRAEVSKAAGLRAGLEAEFKSRGYGIDTDAVGVVMRDECENLNITTQAAFNACFQVERENLAALSVTWHEIKRPGDTKAKRKKRRARVKKAQRQADKCLGTAASCDPCKEWSFTEAEYRPSKDGFEIAITVDAPKGTTLSDEAQLIFLDPPVRARPGDEVGYRVMDRDLIFDDLLADDVVTIRPRHPEGVASHKRFSLRGQCVR